MTQRVRRTPLPCPVADPRDDPVAPVRHRPHAVLLVGDVADVARLAVRAAARPDARYRLIGCCLPGSPQRGAYLHELPVLGGWHDLADVVASSGVGTVVLAPAQEVPEHAVERLAVDAARTGAEVLLTGHATGTGRSRVRRCARWGGPLVRLAPASWRPGVRDLTDRALAALLLAVLLPVLLAAAALVRADGPGPLFARETRVGRFGRRFELLRFRAADDGLVHRWALDELPQLLNVVRGDLALFGPRAPLPSEIGRLSPLVVPGLARPRRAPPRQEPARRPSAR